VALFTMVSGAAAAAGGLMTWMTARGPRPTLGMDHVSLAKMLVWTYTASSLWTSVGFAVLILGVLIVIGAVTGLRSVVVLGALLVLGTAGTWIALVVSHFNPPGPSVLHSVNPADLPWSDLRTGALLTIFGATAALVSAFALRARATGRVWL